MQRANICLSYSVLSKGCISNASLAFAKKHAPLNFHAFHFYSRDFQSFDCMCVFCVRSRNPPSSCITDPKWICCSRTKKVGCFRPSGPGLRYTLYMQRRSTPTPNKKPDTDTSQQTTKASQLPRHRRLTGTTVRFVRYMS